MISSLRLPSPGVVWTRLEIIVTCAVIGALFIGGLLASFDFANSDLYHNTAGVTGAFFGLFWPADKWR